MLPDPYFPWFDPGALACRERSGLSWFQPVLRRVGAPEPLLTLAEARLHLKLDPLPLDPETGALLPDDEVAAHPDDTLVRGLSLAAQAEVDGWNSWTGRGVAVQTWALEMRGWPQGLPLPLPPFREIVSVEYLTEPDTYEVLAPDLYGVRAAAQDMHARLYWKPDVWAALPVIPMDLSDPAAVRITWKAGYDAGDPDLELFKAYAKLRLGVLYENREAVVVGTIATEMPGFSTMLDNLRVSHPEFLK
jgi:hypothetical protein